VSDVSKIYIHTSSVSAAACGAHSVKWVKNFNRLVFVLRRSEVGDKFLNIVYTNCRLQGVKLTQLISHFEII
jgi:hypothetical protein